ncbi:MAG: hypothetical protein LQ343_005730 [Gyalolechia ehrenbergii]|nr:MAG: hypothetical protein LQ343_005730 [Gyalolechia ehrenbergii]
MNYYPASYPLLDKQGVTAQPKVRLLFSKLQIPYLQFIIFPTAQAILYKIRPPEWTQFHIKGDLYFQTRKYGPTEADRSESEVVEALEMIVLDIETGGDEGQVAELAYRRDQVILILGNLAAKPPTTRLTRGQASEITDFILAFTYLYGPRELFAFEVQDRATGKHEYGALHFIPRQ